MTDAAKIARGLTKAQARAVRGALPFGDGYRFRKSTPFNILAFFYWHDLIGYQYSLTPLGLAVRAELERIADE